MNKIIINFTPCNPAPSRGYNVMWRIVGSGDELQSAGNFATSPAVFYDRLSLAGTQYEGIIKSDCGGESSEIAWSTVDGCAPCCVPTGVSALVQSSVQLISGVMTKHCAFDVSSQGYVQIEITFDAPTPAPLTLYFAEVHTTVSSGLQRVGDNIMTPIPAGTTLDPYYNAGPANAHKPFEAFVPAGTTHIVLNGLLGDYFSAPIYQKDLSHSEPNSAWICFDTENYHTTDLYVQIAEADYDANFTLTNLDIVFNNEVKTTTSGNKVTVSFTPCSGIASYGMRWRVAGSSEAYTDAGVFVSSPAVFTDDSNPPGTDYEGFIYAISNESGVCEDVAWSTIIT